MTFVAVTSNKHTVTAEQVAAMEYLRTEFAKLFPNSGVWVGVRTILGETNIHIRYINAASSQDCQSGIDMNDKAYMYFSIWNRKGGFEIEKPTTSRYKLLESFGVKRFVTMKGKTEAECAVKLRDWFAKHAENILALG